MSEVENATNPEATQKRSPYIGSAEIDNRFGYHRATDESIEKHKKVRGVFIEIANYLDSLLPDGREKALVFTSLEEASFWANAGVARNMAPLDLNG